jgi:nitrogen fixation protein FixH
LPFLLRITYVIFTVGMALTLGCSQKPNAPEKQEAASPTPAETGPWHVELNISPEHPSMAKPIIFTLHITDEHAQPVSAAEVTGAVTMKLMDMGTTQLRFAPKGNGDYQASLKDMDMSGPWKLAVDASQGAVHVKKSFEFTVYD